MILLLAACGGPNEETLVDELRVLAMVVEPPEVQPGATATVTTWVADPLGQGPDAMSWSCTNFGDGCLEAAIPSQGTTVERPTDGQIVASVTVPVELAGVVADGETVLPILLWGLACTPGTCDIIDLASTAPAAGTAAADALSTFLGDPYTEMERYPLVDTSLALQTASVSMRATPIVNPVFSTETTEITTQVNASVPITFTVENGFEAWGYTTGGGFEMPRYEVVDGAVTLDWVAPAEAGTATLWVVVTGEEGGSAVWTLDATVE